MQVAREWLIGVVLAAPLVAIYIYLDRNPAPWLSLLLSGGIGAAAGAVSVGGSLALEEEPDLHDRTVWRWVAVGAGVGAWCTTTIPVVFGWSTTVGWWDALARGSWSAASLALLGVGMRREERRPGALPLLAVGVVAFQGFLWLDGAPRIVGGAITLAALLTLAWLGRRMMRRGPR